MNAPLLLPRGVPAIYPQVGTCHEAAGIAEQEDGGPAVVLGLAERVQHVLLGPLGLAFRELREELLHHLRHDVPRGDGVHPDPFDAPFHC